MPCQQKLPRTRPLQEKFHDTPIEFCQGVAHSLVFRAKIGLIVVQKCLYIPENWPLEQLNQIELYVTLESMWWKPFRFQIVMIDLVTRSDSVLWPTVWDTIVISNRRLGNFSCQISQGQSENVH